MRVRGGLLPAIAQRDRALIRHYQCIAIAVALQGQGANNVGMMEVTCNDVLIAKLHQFIKVRVWVTQYFDDNRSSIVTTFTAITKRARPLIECFANMVTRERDRDHNMLDGKIYYPYSNITGSGLNFIGNLADINPLLHGWGE